MAATQDRVPTVYINNGFVDGLSANDTIAVDYEKTLKANLQESLIRSY